MQAIAAPPAVPDPRPPALGPLDETTFDSVAVLRWPADGERRDRLQGRGVPRLLVVGSEDAPPVLRDDLEDWLRDPLTPADLTARIAVLAERADRQRRRPRLDDDGLLWSGGSWVVIPDTQRCVVELLLAHPDELVSTSAITKVYVRHGSSGHRASVRTMLNRVVARFDAVGVRVHIVRGKGALLELPGS
jgi:hypothetical protein